MPPSQRLKVRPLQNDWAAYQFDQAALYVGLVIENAIQERQKVGKESQPKYSLGQLLDADFRLPPKGESFSSGIHALAAANPDVVGRWKQAPGKVQ